MILTLSGNAGVNRNYLQTLCMVFFPGAKFSQSEEKTPDTPCVDVRADADEASGQVFASVRITVGDKSVEKTNNAPIGGSLKGKAGRLSRERSVKVAVGAALFDAGQSFFGYTPPWGMLTGVRPSKLAAELLTGGADRNAVISALTDEYFVNPKKAALAADVAICESAMLDKAGDQSDSCSVYISIPFCPTRCAYCSFVSYSTKRMLSLLPDYLVRLKRDIARIADTVKALGLRVRTVYVGGGTPTVLSEAQLDDLLSEICGGFDVPSLEEFTLESGRPDTVTAEKMRIAREYGVTRVSVNPQTLCEEVLGEIGREHTVAQFFEAYEAAKSAGFHTVNTDVICGLPGDTFYTFSDTVDRLIGLKPENLTFHTFCVKRSSTFLAEGEKLYDRDGGDAGKCVDYSQLRSAEAGYIPYYMYRQKNTVGNYENVGWAMPGHEGYYNIYMMEEIHSIFAAGAGAVTKLIDQSRRGEAAGFGHTSDRTGDPPIKRLFMPKYPYEYLAADENSDKYKNFFESIEHFYGDRK